MSRALVTALAALLTVVLPATADAKVYKGKTDQGKVVRLVTSGGYVRHMTFAWRAQCDQGPGFTSSTIFRPRYYESSRIGVAIDDAYTIKGTKGYRARVIGRLRMVKPGAGYRGTYSLTTKILHNGKLLATCSHTVAFTAGTPAAGPEHYFVGLTQQRRVVALVTDANGVVDDFRIAWEMRCQRKEVYENLTQYRSPFDVSTPAAFQDAGSYQEHYKSERYTITTALSSAPAAGAWSGTLSGSMVAHKGGKTSNRCTLKPVTFSATPA